MADNKKLTLEEQLAASQAATKKAVAQAKAATDKAKKAEEALKTATATGIVSAPVTGTFSVKGTTAGGEELTQKFRFKNGRGRTPLRSGMQVPSDKLIELANGKEIKDIDIDLKAFSWFADLTQEDAQAELQRLVNINASTIEAAK